MAKTSSVEKNNRRRKLAGQYAAKRKALKDIVMDQSKPMEERFRAQLKLSALPRNSAKIRIRNRCEVIVNDLPFGAEAGLMPGGPELAAAADVGEGINAAILKPQLASGGPVGGGLGV